MVPVKKSNGEVAAILCMQRPISELKEARRPYVISTALLVAFQLCESSDNVVVGLVAIATGIAYIVMQVKLVRRVAKSFGKGGGWAALLFFLPFIATLILGFGSAEYLGNPETVKAE
jgi:hypothetical protein